MVQSKGKGTFMSPTDSFPEAMTVGKLFNCTRLCGADISLPCSIKTDSRKIEKGDVFIALKGNRSDGHSFISDAIKRGAKGVILKDEEMSKFTSFNKDISFFGVPSPDAAILEASERYLAGLSSLREIVAITGSVGKTTTKEAIGKVLERIYRVHVSRGNYNTLLGCCLTILAAPRDTEFLVLEMGANAKGEIGEIANKFRPSSSVITSVEPVHLEGFGDIEGVLGAKLEIVTADCKLLFVNGDSPILNSGIDKLKHRPSKIISVGTSSSCLYRITDSSLRWDGNHYFRKITIDSPFGLKTVESKLWGKQHTLIISLAFAVGCEYGVAPDDIVQGLLFMSLPRGRGAILQSDEGVLFIDESYNASPVSVKAAIDNLCLIPSRGRKVAVLGGMKELGSYANRFHDDVLYYAATAADQVLIHGSEWKDINKNYKNVLCLQDMEDIVNHLKAILRTGDVVLVKGSRAYEMERIYDWWSLHEL